MKSLKVLAVAACVSLVGFGVANAAGAKHPKYTSEQYQAVQNALNANGEKVTADGQWSKDDRTALRDFQGKHNLKVTGRLNKATRQALNVSF